MGEEAYVKPFGWFALAVTLVVGGFIAYSLFHTDAAASQQGTVDLADGKYISDLEARGVPTGQLDGTAGAKLGHAVCDDLGTSTATAKVLQVAALQQGNVDQFTTPQAEEIVYWAVTELCPQFSSQLQAHWRDGA